MSAEAYEPVGAALPQVLPPITREEAGRAARRLYQHFGKSGDRAAAECFCDGRPGCARCNGSGFVKFPTMQFRGEIRRCWTSRKPTSGHFKGWGRLIHDISHSVNRRRHPKFRPHDATHALLEAEMARYVAACGWLDGKLKPPVRGPVLPAEKRASKREALVTRLNRWRSKESRAKNAIRKIERQLKALDRKESQIDRLAAERESS